MQKPNNLLNDIMSLQLDIEVTPSPSHTILTQLMDLYQLAIWHFQARQKYDHVRMFVKKMDSVIKRIDQCYSANKEQMQMQVEFATSNSKEGAESLIESEKKKAEMVERSILQSIQSQKRTIAEKIAKRNERKNGPMDYGNGRFELKESFSEEQTTKTTSAQMKKVEMSMKRMSVNNGVQGNRGEQKEQRKQKKKQKKKSRYRIMKEKEENELAVQLLPF